MPKEIANVGASVRARLQNLSRETERSFEQLLVAYAHERLLYRLSVSEFVERFVLKGAMLLTAWFTEPHRATRDLDLLGFGDPGSEAMLEAFRAILADEVDDGVQFDLHALRVDRIREELEYGGLRLRTTASIAGARVAVTVDIGFGDATEPGAEVMDYPTMLDFPAPRIRAYSRETVIAEKFQAMVMFGRANSRMKDFYDIWLISRSGQIDDNRLALAIAATFARRETEIPIEVPDGLTLAFAEDEQKQRQWTAFVREVTLKPGSLVEVIETLREFLMPHAKAAANLTGRS